MQQSVNNTHCILSCRHIEKHRCINMQMPPFVPPSSRTLSFIALNGKRILSLLHHNSHYEKERERNKLQRASL